MANRPFEGVLKRQWRTFGNETQNAAQTSDKSNSGESSGDSKKTTPQDTKSKSVISKSSDRADLRNMSSYFLSNAERKKSGNVFVPSTVMGKKSETDNIVRFTPQKKNSIGIGLENPLFPSDLFKNEEIKITSTATKDNKPISDDLDKKLQKLYEEYKAINDAWKNNSMSAYDYNARISGLKTNNKSVFDAYKKETGGELQIPQLGEMYKRARSAAQQNKKDNEYWGKLKSYYDSYYANDFQKYISDSATSSAENKLEKKLNNIVDVDISTATIEGNADTPHMYLNPKTNKYEAKRLRNGFGSEDMKYLYMTEPEQSIYKYQLNKYGEKAADDFLKRMDLILDKRLTEANNKYTEKLTEEHPVLMATGNVLTAPVRGAAALADTTAQAGKQTFGKEYVPYNPYTNATKLVHQADTVKGTVTKDMSPVAKFFTETGMGVGENVSRMAFGNLALPIMGMNVAGETAVDKGVKGETNATKAFATGAAYGGIEMLTEKIPLDNIFKVLKAPPSTIKEAAVTLLKNAGVEASEEAISNIADNVADNIINKDKSEYEQYKQILREQGYSNEEAEKNAFIKFYITDTGISALQGGLSGGILNAGSMATGAAVNNYNDTVQTGRGFRTMGADVVESVINTGKESDNNTPAYKYAQKMQEKQNKGADLSDWNVGRQYQKNVKAVQSENDFAAAMSNIKHTEIVENLYNDKGQELNGAATSESIKVSSDGSQSIPATIKHEWSHMFKILDSEAYQQYENSVIKAARETNSEAVDSRMDFLMNEYGYNEEVAREEIVAELTGGFNTEAIQRMAVGNKTLAAAIADATRTAKAKLRTAFTDGKYTSTTGLQMTFSQLNQAEKQYIDGLNKARNNQIQMTEARYSPIEYDSDGNAYVRIDEDILEGVPKNEWAKTVRNVLREKFSNGIDYNGENVAVSRKSRNEFTESKYTKNLFENTKSNKFRMANNLDEIINIQNDIDIENPNHIRKDDIVGFERGNTRVAIGDNEFTAEVLIANKKDGTKQFYDIINLQPTKIQQLSQSGRINDVNTEDADSAVSNNSISKNDENVKYSVKEDAEAAENARAPIESYDEFAPPSESVRAAQEKVNALMKEKGVSSPSELAPDTVTRVQSKKDRNVFRGKSTIHNIMSRTYTAVVDDMHPFWNYNKAYEKVSGKTNYGKDNPYKLAINAKDASSRSAYIVSDKMVDYDNNEIGKGLVETITDSGITEDNYNDFNNYLVACHALEWLNPNEHGAYKNVYDVPELNDIDIVSSIAADFENKNPEFRQAAQNLYDWQRQLMKTWLVDTGVITEEQYNRFTEMYPDYVPFFREENVNMSRNTISGFANQGNIFKSAVGTQQRRILQPIENIMYNVASYVNHATKHGVTTAAVRLYDTLESDPANNVLRQYWEEVYPVNPDDNKPKYFKTKDSNSADIQDITQEAENSISQTLREQMSVQDGVVTVIDSGKKRYFRVYDKDFLTVLDNAKAGKFDGFLGIMASFSRTRAALITSWNPAFSLASNPVRDFGTLITNSSDANKAKVAKEALSAYIDIAKGSDAYKQYLSMGGQYSSVTTEGMNAMKIAMQKLQGKDPNLVKRFFKLFPKAFNAYQTISDAIESSPRMAEFKTTLNKGYDFHEAFYRAKDVTTNFSRGGKISKELNTVSNFFNASIQGVDKYFRQARNNPKSFAIGVSCLTAIELLAWAWNTAGGDKDKDEAYENLSNYTKNNFYNFYIGNGKFVTVPKARESAVLSSAISAVLNKTVNGHEDRFKDFFSDYVLSQFLPDGSIIGLSTLSDLRANEDYMSRPIVSSALGELPNELQYDDSTSYLAKWLGGVLKQSPKRIDHIINSEAGVLGKINRTYFTPSGQKDKPTMMTFGVNSTFYKDSLFSTDQVNLFYTNKENANKQANGYPNADNNYLDNRFTQAGKVLSILNEMYKEDSKSDAGRKMRSAYVNYAKDNKKNPTGFSDEVCNELKKLFDTDNKVLSMPSISREINMKIDKEDRSFTFTDSESLLNYQKDLNRGVDEAYRELFSSVEYSAMSDVEKADALSDAKSEAVKEVKRFYIENEGSKRMYGDEVTAITKPKESDVKEYTQKQEYKTQIEEKMQSVSDGVAKIAPDKADSYGVKSFQINDIKSVKIDGKSYDISGEIESKIISAANDEHYSNIEKLMNNEVNVEDIVGYTSKGKVSTAKQADGTKVSLTGKLYNEDGSPRFDELVIAKIISKSKEKSKEHAAEKYRGEITGSSAEGIQVSKSSVNGQGSSTRAKSSHGKSSSESKGSSSNGRARFTSARAAGGGRGNNSKSGKIQFTARSGSGGTIQRNANSNVSLPNAINPQLIQTAVNSFMKNNKINTIKPLENPLFM